MPAVNLSCPKSNCNGMIRATTSSLDQSLICPVCSEVFTFFNVADVRCGTCSSDLQVNLNSETPRVLCEKCGQKNRAPLDRTYAPRRLDEDNSLMYCGRDYFSDHHDEVEIAKRAFARIEKAGNGWFTRKQVKKGIFINRLELEPRPEIAVERLRILHAYCNFKRYEGHSNAKFMGLVPAFASGSPFAELIKNCGLVDIWVRDERLLQELLTFPKVRPFAPRIHTLP
jgi:hypothetical protein